MNVNLMNLLLAKTVVEQQGVPAARAFEISLVSSMFPGWTGLMLAIVAAKNEPKPRAVISTNTSSDSTKLPAGPTAK